jgi:hypothetical protein
MQQAAYFNWSLQGETSAERRDISEPRYFVPVQIRRLPTSHADGKFQFQSLANALPGSLLRHTIPHDKSGRISRNSQLTQAVTNLKVGTRPKMLILLGF